MCVKLCVCVWCTWVCGASVWADICAEARGQLLGVSSSLPLYCGLWGPNSGHQTFEASTEHLTSPPGASLSLNNVIIHIVGCCEEQVSDAEKSAWHRVRTVLIVSGYWYCGELSEWPFAMSLNKRTENVGEVMGTMWQWTATTTTRI